MLRQNLPFVIFSALILAVLISLGNWQMRRMAEKQDFLGAIEARIAADPVALPGSPDPEKDRFMAVRTAGQLLGPEVHVLMSTRDFGAGYRVIRAFETDGRRVLIDLGFIRLTDKDRARPGGRFEITGNLYWPEETDGYTPAADPSANIWYARDVAPLARHLNTDPVMIIARELAPALPRVRPLPTDTGSIPNRHLEYVLTWYGLALTWVIMSGYFLFRRKAGRTGATKED